MDERVNLRRLKRRAGFRLVHAVALISRRGGLGFVRRCGELLGELHYRVDRHGRRDLARQLAHALAVPTTEDSRPLLRQAYRANDGAALEIVAMYCGRFAAEELRAHCRVDGIERLHETLAAGRGMILLGMHMGNGMLMAARLAVEGLPVTVVYRESHKVPNGFFERIGAQHGTEGIHVQDPASAYRQMRRALDRGRILFVLMDQATRDGGVPVTFLGKALTMPVGPSELARRTGAPVLTALPVAARPAWRFRVGEPLQIGAADAAALATEFTCVLERHIREYPHLWSWHHRRWRRLPFETATVEP
jgi:phosphatidylinositol dimannoside acyltransferase